MPDGFQTDFQKQLANWEKKFLQITGQTKGLQGTLSAIESKQQRIATLNQPEWMQQFQESTAGRLLKAVEMPTAGPAMAAQELWKGFRLKAISPEIAAAHLAFSKNLFYGDVYGVVPALVLTGAVNSVDEALSSVSVPADLSEAELQAVRKEISDLLAARNAGLPSEAGEIPELESEEYPPLVAPPQTLAPKPVSLHRLTTETLRKSLLTVYPPPQPTTEFSQEEYDQYLREKGWSEEDIDRQLEIQKDTLIAEAANRKSLMEAYRSGVAEMPEWTTMDILKAAVVNPPLVVLEGLNIYYEHVSMPAAGWLYGDTSGLARFLRAGPIGILMGRGEGISDITKAYNDFKSKNPDSTNREAWVHAWHKWEAPGPPVLDFILKYMLMEGLVDPLSYAGWGFITKGMRTLGPVGRFLARGNVAVAEVLELPFDGIKWVAKSVIPKTVSQRAAVITRNSQSFLDMFFERYTYKGTVPFSTLKVKDMTKTAEYALKHLADNPRAEDDLAIAARHMLAHPPVTKAKVGEWIDRLRRTGVSTFEKDSITDQTLLSIDELFERVFNQEMTAGEAAPFLMQKLGVLYTKESTEDINNLLARFIADRVEQFNSRALDFLAGAKTANQAMRNYARKALRVNESVVASDVLREAHKSGRFQVLMYNVDKRLIQPWMSQVNRMVIRPAAESYLTFGLYGPLNTIEDVMRSFLGGVRPGRMNREGYETMVMGLKGDPELLRAGISETYGPMRDIGEVQRSNWILTIGALPLSLPTYAATRGRIAPQAFAKGTYKTMVESFGAMGIDIRRNFVSGKYNQLLSELGGDSFKLLDDAVTSLPPELSNAAKWVKRNLQKDLRAAATTGKFTSENTALIETLKNRYTHEKIVRAEVDDIIKRYGDISPTARSMVLDGYDEKLLMESSDSINSYMKTVMDAEVDDFLRGPERATVQYDNLTKLLTSMEVTHPDDMADLIVSLHKMTATYGALPDQIMARATVKSRGLPVGDRRLHVDAESDRLQTFLEKAGADIDRVVEKIRATTIEPARVGAVDWSTVTFSKQIPADLQESIRSLVNNLPIDIKVDIRGVKFNPKARYAYGGAVPQGAFYDRGAKSITFTSLKEIKDPMTLYHEISHGVMSDVIASGDKSFPDRFAVLVEKSVDWGEVTSTAARIGEPVESVFYRHNRELSEKFSDRFAEYLAGAEISKPMNELFKEFFPKAQRDLKLSSAYQGATQRYLDLVTTHRQVASAAKSRDLAFRHEYFADATQKDLRNPAFWDSFYASEMAHWKNVNKQLATVNSQLHQAINDINLASGVKMPPRAAIKVVGRELAPADVAKLMQTRGDDLSRMLLDTLIPEGDKDYFVEYIMGLVRTDDTGFTREAVGTVYDQIAASIQVDQSSSSWFRVRQKQIESMTKDFHDLYNAKLFPKEQKVAVDRYIDETVSKVDNVVYRAGGKGEPVQVMKDEFKNYDSLRQQALDEANKWYYKEYTDYTNANAFDAIMKSLYPFWTYESQRWFWLPRTFLRRPATLTTWGRWEDNTDYGYFHVPGTSIDVNPARGSVFGPWSTRLMRRDYPEYYDELEGMGGMVGFFDFVSRYGFYPNVIFGALQAQFGGATGQLGGILPSIYSTPLNAMIAAFPDNKLVEFISERVFPEVFRSYLTSRRVDDLGGDGSLLFAKRKAGQELTEEEQAMWAEARQSVALHSALFEQLGFARMRSDQSYELAEASAKFIEEQYGFTPEQQHQLRLRGEKLWDLIGGLDPWETAMLQELEFYKYSGSINPVLPSHQQEILNRVELDWSDVMSYSENQRSEILELQQDFLTGSERGRLGPDDFLARVRALYDDRRKYIDEKTKANPLMLLENRVDYYAKYGQVMPVQSPYNELMDMYFSINLEETVDPATGARVYDWDKFWANREMITDSIPADDKGQWDTFLTRNTAPMMEVWHDVYSTYLKKYYSLWDKVLSTYPEDEQKLINEYLFLERTGQKLERQLEIKESVSAKSGRQLISSFRSSVSDEREALRYANPHLDAWLYYWGRTSSFQTLQAEKAYHQLAARTGRRID